MILGFISSSKTGYWLYLNPKSCRMYIPTHIIGINTKDCILNFVYGNSLLKGVSHEF